MNELTARNTKVTKNLATYDSSFRGGRIAIVESFRSLRNFFRQSIITAAPFDESLSHHEGREGHEDRITERASNLKKMFSSFVCFVVKILTFGCGFAAPGSM
jgi:hypothetical protein